MVHDTHTIRRRRRRISSNICCWKSLANCYSCKWV